MREYSNNEQSCEEQREEEQFKALLEKQMRREAEQIEEELENNPEIAGLSPDDSAKDKLYEKIEEYERQQAVRRLSPEDQEALRLGRQIQKEKALGRKNTVDSKSGSGYRRKRFFKRLAGVAAVFVIVTAVGITGVGGPDRVMEVIQKMIGERKLTTINSSDKDIVEFSDVEEDEAYEQIKDDLGIDPVRMVKQLPDMKFVNMQLDEELRVANVFYEKQGEIISYIINCSQEDAVWGSDVEDILLEEYRYPLKSTETLIQEYEIEETGEKKYVANFEYRKVNYQLAGIMTREQLEEILNNLHFL
ncbi:DUF4367 domain-containing protein [Faecalicatena contorta]|uniref:DUF4367 domain-containing protein n=1 Tax=Clostridia TaxID=186801 RepID=UPI00051B22A0|nr:MULTISPECIES: DUF4367 domain-containing protein [Clostridia]MBM6685121.1 DUF4367 domain-containing protein [Faecalicatena contorta]MBM6710968.1 DUF4367 domain-containing protein [Faecalicatena contorta]